MSSIVGTGLASIVNTKCIFLQHLFEKWDLLQKRLPGSSESGLLTPLEDLSILKGRIGQHLYTV